MINGLYGPEAAVGGGGAPGDDLGDVDAGVLTNVRVVCPPRDAEPKTRVTL